MPLTLGIDANEANIYTRVGSNVYAFQILNQLYKQRDENTKVKIFLKNKPLPDLPPEEIGWQYQVLKPSFFFTQWRLPLQLYLSPPKIDLFFTLGHYAPRFCPSKTVISIMDLAFLRFPEQFKREDLAKLKNWTKYSVSKASHIFTISQFCKQELIHFYKINPEKITVTYPGVSLISDVSKKTKEKFLTPYFCYVGTLQPRKNLLNLIRAWKKIDKFKLVIVGKKGWMYDEIFKLVKELGLEKQVVFTGFISEIEKQSLIKKAQALILPSLYEGFGIPVVEAMNLKTPVIVSQNSSLVEIVGGGGIYIQNPQNPDSIVLAINKMLKLTGKEKEKLLEENFTQAKKFTWEKCGRQTWEVLCSLLKTNRAKN